MQFIFFKKTNRKKRLLLTAVPYRYIKTEYINNLMIFRAVRSGAESVLKESQQELLPCPQRRARMEEFEKVH